MSSYTIKRRRFTFLIVIMYLRSYEMPQFRKMKLPQETKRCLNFISQRCWDGKIKFVTHMALENNDEVFIFEITDNVWNPIDTIEVTKKEVEAYNILKYNF